MTKQVQSTSDRGDALRFFGRTLAWLRWAILAAMLAVTLLWPVPGRTGHSIWLFVIVLGVYNLGIDLLRRWVPRLHSFGWVPLIDLVVVGGLYYLDYEPGGPLFVFFYLALITAASTMSLRGTIGYTLAVLAVVTLVAPTLPGWSATGIELRQLTSRLIVMSMVGIGTAILSRRLVAEQAIGRQMRDEAERLEALGRLRNEFIASISHDLRTPITAARAGLGMLELNQHGSYDPQEIKLLANVQRNIERLNLLINELLTLNQLQAGVLHLDLEPFDLRDVVADAVGAVQPLLRAKAQTIELDLPDPLPVLADGRRLEQLLVNLLANAHQHTAEGTRISVAGCSRDREVRLAVQDNGSGIPPAELERVFQRFYRFGSEDGSGLGLAIVRGIAELHGGRVWAERAPDGGTRIVLVLPQAEYAVSDPPLDPA